MRILLSLIIAASLTACVNTKWFAAEYDRQYYLAEDVNVYTSYVFTGVYSVWFSGPQKVETICSAKTAVADSIMLRKCAPVRILKLYTIAAIDESSRNAKLQIVDTKSNTEHIVYIKWTDSNALLTTECRS